MEDLNYKNKIILKKLVQDESNKLQEEINEYNRMPNGELVTRRKNEKYFYSFRDSHGEHGISRDKELVRLLARKKYLKASIATRKNNIKVLNNCICNLELRNSCALTPAIAAGLPSIDLSKKELLWMDTAQSQNHFRQEQLIYKTRSGVFVRSKSERLIADKLFEHKLLFKYEAPMVFEGLSLYPDFTILREDGRVVLWEHNGLMTSEEYFLKTIQKIRKYNKAGFVQHLNLICTEEKDIENDDILEEIIIRFLL